jgi:hypothetical protein
MRRGTGIEFLVVLALTGLGVYKERVFAGESRGMTETWLFIGDSHSVRGFGDGLRDTLFHFNPGLEGRFHQFSVTGSTAANWLDGTLQTLKINWAKKIPGASKQVIEGPPPPEFTSFPALAAKIHPTHAIIALGTNDFFSIAHGIRNAGSETREKMIDSVIKNSVSLLDHLDGAKCFWVTPPALKVPSPGPTLQKELEEYLVKRLGHRCTPIRSSAIPEPGHPDRPISADQKDGVHFFSEKGRVWGAAAAEMILKVRD